MRIQPYRDLRTGETRAGVETHTISTRATVNLDLTRVGLEVLRRVFCGDTALNGKATLGDCLLSETELRERSTRGDLDLCGDDVDARDFLCKSKIVSRVFTTSAGTPYR